MDTGAELFNGELLLWRKSDIDQALLTHTL
jgi:hypothetical protein